MMLNATGRCIAYNSVRRIFFYRKPVRSVLLLFHSYFFGFKKPKKVEKVGSGRNQKAPEPTFFHFFLHDLVFPLFGWRPSSTRNERTGASQGFPSVCQMGCTTNRAYRRRAHGPGPGRWRMCRRHMVITAVAAAHANPCAEAQLERS